MSESMYQEIILDHYRNPRHKGLREGSPSGYTEVHHVNPTCGDEVTLRIHTEGDTITSLSWEGHGCAISQASASLLSDVIVDLDRAAVQERIDAFRELMRSKGTLEGDEDLLGDAVVLGGVSRYIARVKCAMLAWVALEDAMAKTPAA